MKPLKIILIIILATVCLSLTAADYHRVKFVYDGDTILLDNKSKVRYLGVNSPEIDHKGGKSEFMAHAARNLNLELVKRARVSLEFDKEKKDRYGRLLAYVFLENGEMVNALLVRKGMAHVLLNNLGLKYGGILLDCQRKAMKEKLGIWSRPFKVQEKFYLGNRNSYRFHRPDCPFAKKISRKNGVRFKSRYDAFREGYSPCKRCRP
ncbi:MAG: thermonuclease family protein [Deltaproteobacteria bacterium]|nr:thermonuclease family protein [Deltaproteobacteria bacterium]MBW2116450.1 thermonuclease family protein [Deltaproteobacteria bacterium]MBW2343063.1 thermonuclease family protein [Deltaproteobacteria bacterium]